MNNFVSLEKTTHFLKSWDASPCRAGSSPASGTLYQISKCYLNASKQVIAAVLRKSIRSLFCSDFRFAYGAAQLPKCPAKSGLFQPTDTILKQLMAHLMGTDRAPKPLIRKRSGSASVDRFGILSASHSRDSTDSNRDGP